MKMARIEISILFNSSLRETENIFVFVERLFADPFGILIIFLAEHWWLLQIHWGTKLTSFVYN